MPDIRDEITRWTREGASLELIEERIGGLPASDEGKSALWLWAWSCRRPGESHRRCSPTNRKPVTRRLPALSFTRDTAWAMSEENVEIVRERYGR